MSQARYVAQSLKPLACAATPYIAGAGMALLVAAPALRAQATTPPPPVYKACYVGDKTGTVYRVDDPNYPAPGAYPASTRNATGCAGKNDQPFTWNHVGPKGDTGDAGPQGPQGPPGADAVIGPDLSLTGNFSANNIHARGNTQLDLDARVNGNLVIGNELTVGGVNTFVHNLTVRGGANVLSDFQVGGGGNGNLNVVGSTTIRDNLTVHGALVTVNGALAAGLGSVRAEAPVAGGESRSIIARCPAGKAATGGGFDFTRGGSPTILASRPLAGNDGWEVFAENAPGAPGITVGVHAVCSRMR